MLKLKNLIENDETAEKLIANYGFKDMRYGFFRSSSNVVYWVKGDGKIYFLRYTTEDERKPESILAEIDYINYLRNHGINVNKPVKTKSGQYLIRDNGILAVLFERVEGKPLEDIELIPEICREWGRQLGKIHKLSDSYNADMKRPGYKEVFKFIHPMLDEDLIGKAHLLEESLDKLPKISQNYGLCHYDFEMDNVYYNEENGEFAVIDFDDSMYNFYAIDIMQVLMNIEEDIPHESQIWAKEEFKKGYEEYKVLPDKEEMNLASKFILLNGYAKIAYCLSYPPVDEPDWMEELIVKLEGIQRDKKHMLDEIK